MDEQGYEKNGRLYADVLNYLENNEINPKELEGQHYFNDWFKTKNR